MNNTIRRTATAKLSKNFEPYIEWQQSDIGQCVKYKDHLEAIAAARAEALREAAERAVLHVQDRCYCGMTLDDSNSLRDAIMKGA